MNNLYCAFKSLFKSVTPYFLIAVIVLTSMLTFATIKPAQAAAGPVVTAASGSASAIQSAVNSLGSGGGTVNIPAGTFNLGGSVKVPANVTLIGAGMDKTVLKTSGSSQYIAVQGDNVRISGFTLTDPNNNGGNGVLVGGSSGSRIRQFRIDHLHIQGYDGQAGVRVEGDCEGVIDHCTIIGTGATSLNYGVVIYGDDVWQTDMQLGTEHAVFVEDCQFSNFRHAIAANNAAHYVFRYNTLQNGVKNQAIDAHGPYYNGESGTLAFEIYGNVIKDPESAGSERGMRLRGGGGVVFDNTVTGYKYGVMLAVEDGQTGSYPYPQMLHDVYIWDNTVNGGQEVVVQSGSTSDIKENREYYLKAMPGYKPYAYPHPLVTGGSAPVNNAPAAADNAYSIDQDSVLTVSAPGILGNDTDPEGAAVTAVPVSNPAHGSLSLNANGSFSYTPASGFSGQDAFSYKASDGVNSSNTATVTITVKAVVTPTPSPVNDSPFGLDQGNNTYDQLPGVINAMRFQNNAGDGTLTQLQLLVDDSSVSGTVRIGVYADDNDAPGALILDAGEVSLANGWVTVSNLNLPVKDGAYYWLAFNLQTQTGIRYQTGQPANSHNWVSGSFGPMPARFPSGFADNNKEYVMRAVVSASTEVNPPAAPVEKNFGLDEGNNTYDQLPGVINAMRFQNNAGDGTLTQLQLLVDDSSVSGTVRIGVYADDNDAPGALILDAGEVSLANGWVTVSNLNLPVKDGAYYWLAFNLQTQTGIRYQTGQPANSHNWVSGSFGPMPARFPSGFADNNNEYVMCAAVSQS